jgi:hypothetical protein
MSEDWQESSTEHTVSNHDIEENTRAHSEQNFLSVLTAMQASMSQTNEYLKCIFEGRHTIEKRPRASDAGYVDEAENGEQPAPKRAIREVKIPRFRCTGTSSMILVSNIFVDVCTFTRN